MKKQKQEQKQKKLKDNMNRRNGRKEKGEETRIVKQINKIEKED